MERRDLRVESLEGAEIFRSGETDCEDAAVACKADQEKRKVVALFLEVH